MAPADTVLGTRGAEPLSHIELRFGPLAQVPNPESDAMNEAQFTDLKQTLVDLLTPGYELSKLCLAQMQARLAEDAAQAEPPQANEFIEGERKAENAGEKEDGAATDPAATSTDPAAAPAPGTIAQQMPPAA